MKILHAQSVHLSVLRTSTYAGYRLFRRRPRICIFDAMLRATPLRPGGASSPDELIHRLLASSHEQRLAPRRTAGDFDTELARETSIRRIERTFVEAERANVAIEARAVPRDATSFLSWFESQNETGPGQRDTLFAWLAQHADREQMRWFLNQEFANETGFGDLVALTQVNMPTRAKLELARNYWDEMGRGIETQVHRTIPTLGVRPVRADENTIVWESLALGNLMVALATARHYAYQSLGALGAVELTAPSRAQLVTVGLKRLGISGAAHDYYAFSAAQDARHSAAWNREVLGPLVTSDPSLAPVIAEGALLRLHAGARCFERYRRQLWGRQDIIANFEYAEDDQQGSGGSGVHPVSEPNRSPGPEPVLKPVAWRTVSARSQRWDKF